jgi:hypothetical protein
MLEFGGFDLDAFATNGLDYNPAVVYQLMELKLLIKGWRLEGSTKKPETGKKSHGRNILAQPISSPTRKAYVKLGRTRLTTGSPKPAPVAPKPLPEGYEELCCGEKCAVVIKSSVKREIEKKATREQQAGLAPLIERYAAGGWENIPRGKFNANEGSFSSATGGRIRLEAFKPHQLRAYGFCAAFNGRPTFFITGVDTSKKQDRANQTILGTAGTEAVRISGLI